MTEPPDSLARRLHARANANPDPLADRDLREAHHLAWGERCPACLPLIFPHLEDDKDPA